MINELVNFIATTLFTTLVMEPFLFAPAKRWWKRQREGKERLLLLDEELRWQEAGRKKLLAANGEPFWQASAVQVHRGFRDHCRAWYRHLTQCGHAGPSAPLW